MSSSVLNGTFSQRYLFNHAAFGTLPWKWECLEKEKAIGVHPKFWKRRICDLLIVIKNLYLFDKSTKKRFLMFWLTKQIVTNKSALPLVQHSAKIWLTEWHQLSFIITMFNCLENQDVHFFFQVYKQNICQIWHETTLQLLSDSPFHDGSYIFNRRQICTTRTHSVHVCETCMWLYLITIDFPWKTSFWWLYSMHAGQWYLFLYTSHPWRLLCCTS